MNDLGLLELLTTTWRVWKGWKILATGWVMRLMEAAARTGGVSGNLVEH